MKQNDVHNQQAVNELDDDLAGRISTLKTEQLTEDDYQKMESNLQRMIIEEGNREESQVEVSQVKITQPQNIKLIDQLKAIFSPVFSWQSMRLAGSMGAIVAVVLTVVFMGAPSKTAFATVLSKMQLASSMFYSSRIESNGQHLMDVKVYHRVPGQLRVETLPLGNAESGAVINVLNLEERKGVIFFPGPKLATPFNFDIGNKSSSPEEDPLYWYEQLKNYQGEPAEYLAAKKINGVLAEGFIIRENGTNITVWADTKNHFPVKLIVTLDKTNGQVPFKMVADLKYNQTFDDALFSLEIGAGYNISAEDAEHH